MKSFFSTVLLLAAATLSATTKTASTATSSTIAIETYSESCAGETNGSFLAQSTTTNWSLGVYRNGTLINTLAVAGRDTLVHGYSIGCYTFAYTANDGSTASISTVLTAPAQIISLCRVHYLSLENTVSFVNLSAGAVRFDWNFGDGGDHSAEISPVHTYTAEGTYTVTLTAYNLNGCSVTSTYTVVIGSSETGMMISPAPAQGQMKEPIRTIVH